MTAVSYSVDRVVAGQGDTIWYPQRITRRHAILYSPPGADNATGGMDPTVEPGLYALLKAFADCGHLVIVGDFDGHAYGHDTLITEWETFRSTGLATLAAKLPGGDVIDTSKLIVGGHSQGTVDATRYAQVHPSNVAGCFCLPGVFDLTGFYSGTYRWGGDAGSLNQANIGSAWSVTPPAALPSQADPYDNAALMASVPTWIGYSDGDTTCTTAQCQAFATAVGGNATAVRTSASTAHGDGEAADALASGLVPWILQAAA